MGMRVPGYWRNMPFLYRLAGWKCVHCGAFHHYKPVVCRRCRSKEFAQVELPGSGRLIAYTVVKSPPKEFERCAPYAIGLIELEDGTKILSQLTDFKENELRDDIRVEAVFRRVRINGEQGIIEYGYKFRPALSRS
jgi:uncharacterized OB-fold protein